MMMKLTIKKVEQKTNYNYPVYAVDREKNDLYIFYDATSATKINGETGKGSLVSFRDEGGIDELDTLDILKPGDRITLHQK